MLSNLSPSVKQKDAVEVLTKTAKITESEANLVGAGGGSRTHKSFTSEDFKSSASANSATPAIISEDWRRRADSNR